VCYTYGTWFGIEALLAVGKSYETCEAIRKACVFLLSKQLDDGGWGESYLSSTTQAKFWKKYCSNKSIKLSSPGDFPYLPTKFLMKLHRELNVVTCLTFQLSFFWDFKGSAC
jgi:Squalene-hopene cyclase C-terminal domain